MRQTYRKPAPLLLHTLKTSLISAFALVCCLLSSGQPIVHAEETKPDFRMEVLVDFVDDVLLATEPVTAQHIDALMKQLSEWGIRRVSWAYYGDGHGGYVAPTEYADTPPMKWANYVATYQGLGNPLKVAVEAGHRHNIEVYAYFKPYETGAALLFPEGSPDAKSMGKLPHLGGQLPWLEPFVIAHPELRIKRRTDDLPADLETKAIHTIRLVKGNDAPTRITKEHLQIWTSKNNWQYQRKQVDFQFADAVEKIGGRSMRVVTLSGLNLVDKFVLVTTDFEQGQPDFVNSGLQLMTAMDSDEKVIPGTFANGKTVWCPNLMDFRKQGLTFDYGFGYQPVTLDAPNANGRQGFIAFTRGRNAYLPGALCETEPAVQEFWLRCLDEMIEAGVDGVDFREENHSTHTDWPTDYGFNDAILKQCGDLKGQELLNKISEVRGAAYTSFLQACKTRLARADKKMRYNLQLDWLRPNRPADRALAYPLNIDWQWWAWIEGGLMDEAILRFYAFQTDEVLANKTTAEVLEACQKKSLPITFNRYLSGAGDKLPQEIDRIRKDGRFSGFILYENYNFIRFGANGSYEVNGLLKKPEVLQAIKP